MSDGAHGGSSQPGQAKEGADAAHGHNEQQVQVEARSLLQHALLLGDDQPGWGQALPDARSPGPSLADNCVFPELPARSLYLPLESGGPAHSIRTRVLS